MADIETVEVTETAGTIYNRELNFVTFLSTHMFNGLEGNGSISAYHSVGREHGYNLVLNLIVKVMIILSVMDNPECKANFSLKKCVNWGSESYWEILLLSGTKKEKSQNVNR